MTESTLDIPGAALHVDIRGERPRAVFVHGLAGDLHTWDAVWRELGPSFPALRYDLRDHGASVSRSRPFNHATDLLHLLDAAGIERCDLIGVSMGGGIALNFALEHPERVARLVLISPAMVGWEWSDAWRTLWRPIAAHARAGALDEARELWWQHPLFDPTRHSPIGQELHESIRRFSCAPWIRDDHEPLLPDIERVHTLQMPTVLMSAGRDLGDFRLIADLIAASAGDVVERIDFPECGHLIHLEDPQGCAARIRSVGPLRTS